MNRRLLSKKNSCWSTSSELADVTANFEKCLNFENLALESAIKMDTPQKKYPDWHD